MTKITEGKDKWTNVGVPLFEDLFKGGIPKGQLNLIYGKSNTGKSFYMQHMLINWKRKYRISKIIKILGEI